MGMYDTEEKEGDYWSEGNEKKMKANKQNKFMEIRNLDGSVDPEYVRCSNCLHIIPVEFKNAHRCQKKVVK